MKIFVQIASYRDPQLVPTIKNMLENAKRPKKRWRMCNAKRNAKRRRSVGKMRRMRRRVGYGKVTKRMVIGCERMKRMS